MGMDKIDLFVKCKYQKSFARYNARVTAATAVGIMKAFLADEQLPAGNASISLLASLRCCQQPSLSG